MGAEGSSLKSGEERDSAPHSGKTTEKGRGRENGRVRRRTDGGGANGDSC